MLEASLTYWQAHDVFETFRFHHISTDEVFGSLPNERSLQFTEKTLLYDPKSPYSASKASSITSYDPGMQHMACQFY